MPVAYQAEWGSPGSIAVVVLLLGSFGVLAWAWWRQRVLAGELRTRLARTRDRLAEQQDHDAFTGLLNRRGLLARLDDQIRNAGSASPTLLFVSLDGLKTINDIAGHEAGDIFMRKTVDKLRSALGPGDLLARLDGAEFAIYLDQVRDIQHIHRMCRLLLDALETPVTVQGSDVLASPCIGVARAPRDGDHASLLLQHAETAMYAIRHQGAGAYGLFQAGMHERTHARQRLEIDLRNALHEKAITVVYQPILDLQAGAIIGVEALARWKHPEHGAISPTVFVPMAERMGLIDRLGDQILGQILQQIHRWDREGPHIEHVCINISLMQLYRADFAQRFSRCVREAGVAARRLRIEITESAPMRLADDTVSQLHQLHRDGFQLLVDDFGTGYSSLNHLRHLPVGTVKIDQSFVRNGLHNIVDHEIVASTISLARKLGLSVVAEGVEDAAQLDWLRELGCNAAQGFHLGVPMHASKFESLLAASAKMARA